MYITGTLYSFKDRLHRLPTGIDSLTEFRCEDDNYTFTSGFALQINQEYRKKYYLFTKDPGYLTGWYITPCANNAITYDYESGVALNNFQFSFSIDESVPPQGISINNVQFSFSIDEPVLAQGLGLNNIQLGYSIDESVPPQGISVNNIQVAAIIVEQ